MLIRRLARPLLAAVFIYGGIGVLRDVPGHASAAAPVLDKAEPVTGALPDQAPSDPETMVRIDGAVKIGAGALLAIGKFPRLASLALAGSVVPSTLAAHAFWKLDDPDARAEQQIHFLKNLGLLGGLLLSGTDHGRGCPRGKPHAKQHGTKQKQKQSARGARKSRRGNSAKVGAR